MQDSIDLTLSDPSQTFPFLTVNPILTITHRAHFCYCSILGEFDTGVHFNSTLDWVCFNRVAAATPRTANHTRTMSHLIEIISYKCKIQDDIDLLYHQVDSHICVRLRTEPTTGHHWHTQQRKSTHQWIPTFHWQWRVPVDVCNSYIMRCHRLFVHVDGL